MKLVQVPFHHILTGPTKKLECHTKMLVRHPSLFGVLSYVLTAVNLSGDRAARRRSSQTFEKFVPIFFLIRFICTTNVPQSQKS